jgi:hypothetical protein
MDTQPTTPEQGVHLFQGPNDDYYRSDDPPPQSPQSMASMSEQSSPQGNLPAPNHPYDPDRPQYLYLDNGDGSLFEAGEAGPKDFHPDGTIHGPRPAIKQYATSNSIQRAYDLPPQLNTSITIATQETTNCLHPNYLNDLRTRPTGMLHDQPQDSIPTSKMS